MKIMDVGDALGLQDVRPDLVEVDPLGRRFEQDVDGVPEESPGRGMIREGR